MNAATAATCIQQLRDTKREVGGHSTDLLAAVAAIRATSDSITGQAADLARHLGPHSYDAKAARAAASAAVDAVQAVSLGIDRLARCAAQLERAADILADATTGMRLPAP